MCQEEPSIRKAAEKDVEAIAQVHVQSWQATYQGLIPNFIIDRMTLERRSAAWATIIAENVTETFVIEGESIFGFINCGATRDRDEKQGQTGEVTAIYLLPSRWRCRFGSQLLEHAISHLAKQGFREVTLWVLDTNLRARQFYEASGFSFDSQSKQDVRGKTTLVEFRYGYQIRKPIR